MPLEKWLIFKTSKSYRGYAPSLLMDYVQWTQFNGNLLLCNVPKLDIDITDTRYVGHCLRRGYSSLRWTANAEKYLQLPEYIGRGDQI